MLLCGGLRLPGDACGEEDVEIAEAGVATGIDGVKSLTS